MVTTAVAVTTTVAASVATAVAAAVPIATTVAITIAFAISYRFCWFTRLAFKVFAHFRFLIEIVAFPVPLPLP